MRTAYQITCVQKLRTGGAYVEDIKPGLARNTHTAELVTWLQAHPHETLAMRADARAAKVRPPFKVPPQCRTGTLRAQHAGWLCRPPDQGEQARWAYDPPDRLPTAEQQSNTHARARRSCTTT